MEISDYFRIARRRMLLLLVIPVLAASGTAAVLNNREPQRFRASATLNLADLAPTSRELSQVVANFQAAAHTPAILKAVQEETGEPLGRLSQGIVASRLGDSGIMLVSYRTVDRTVAPEVARSTAVNALQFLVKPQRDALSKAVADADAAYKASQEAVDALVAEAGVPTPDSSYQQLQSELSQLQLRLEDARTNAKPTSFLEAAIADRQARLDTLKPLVGRYRKLVSESEAAGASLRDARTALRSARGDADPKAISEYVSVSGVTPVPRLRPIVRSAIVAGVTGVFLAVLLVAALELRRSSVVRVRSAPDRVEHEPVASAAT